MPKLFWHHQATCMRRSEANGCLIYIEPQHRLGRLCVHMPHPLHEDGHLQPLRGTNVWQLKLFFGTKSSLHSSPKIGAVKAKNLFHQSPWAEPKMEPFGCTLVWPFWRSRRGYPRVLAWVAVSRSSSAVEIFEPKHGGTGQPILWFPSPLPPGAKCSEHTHQLPAVPRHGTHSVLQAIWRCQIPP